MFEIKNVTKKFGDELALRDISMTIGKGLNFIIGSSGSGKTTLLKIISGMEQSFDGDVSYCGQSIKNLNEQEKSYFYNNVFGFVWQDFNLIDDLTVLENVMLPQYLKHSQDKKTVARALRELKISELANQKVGKLSGGQKQRVAIARELLKNPQVIIADEPTSALDEKSAKTTMAILRDISKTRTVIIVTHDTSLIDAKSKVYELDKGELITSNTNSQSNIGKLGAKQVHKLSFSNACRLALKNTKSNWGRFATTSISLIISATLLLVTVSGAITDSSQSAFDDLFASYGQSLLDISVVGSFMSASGTSGNDKGEPNADVSQNIDGLYEHYLNDARVSHIVFTQAFHDVTITVDGESYEIDTSNSVPTVNELTAGVMPMGIDNEVVVPNSFATRLGLTDKEIIGKTINFDGFVYNWNTGEPVAVPVKTTATIVGVVDTTVKYDSGDVIKEYTVDDSFFFSKTALDSIRLQADIQNKSSSFTIRTKTPSDLIAVKDELNADGIVPLGRFELVEDIVRLNQQTEEQSSSAIIVIAVLSMVIALIVSMMTALTRKHEYAIYKVSGYSTGHLTTMTTAEALIVFIISSVLFLCISPLTNIATINFWDVNILNSKLLVTGVLLVLAMGVLSALVTMFISRTTQTSTSLKKGGR